MRLASVVAEPWEMEEAAEKQRASSWWGRRAGAGEVSGEGDSQRSWGGLSSGTDAIEAMYLKGEVGGNYVRRGSAICGRESSCGG